MDRAEFRIAGHPLPGRPHAHRAVAVEAQGRCAGRQLARIRHGGGLLRCRWSLCFFRDGPARIRRRHARVGRQCRRRRRRGRLRLVAELWRSARLHRGRGSLRLRRRRVGAVRIRGRIRRRSASPAVAVVIARRSCGGAVTIGDRAGWRRGAGAVVRGRGGDQRGCRAAVAATVRQAASASTAAPMAGSHRPN